MCPTNSVAALVRRYLGLYTKKTPRWHNPARLVGTYDWIELTESSMMEYLLHKGVSRRFIAELVEGATRVNYGQVSLWSPRVELASNSIVIRTLILFTRLGVSFLLLLTMPLGLREVTVLFSMNSWNDLVPPSSLTPMLPAYSPVEIHKAG